MQINYWLNLVEQGESSMINDYRDRLDQGDCVVEEWRPMT